MALSTSSVPDNFLENDELTTLFRDMNLFSLPRRRFVPDIESKNCKKISDIIQLYVRNISTCSLTTDGWSSLRQHQYNAVMLHTITEKFEFLVICAGVTYFSKKGNRKQTASNLAAAIKETLQNFGSAQGGMFLFRFSFYN